MAKDPGNIVRPQTLSTDNLPDSLAELLLSVLRTSMTVHVTRTLPSFTDAFRRIQLLLTLKNE